MRTYFWDFFGPRAESSAETHLGQLDGFLEKNPFEEGSTGLRMLEFAHHVTWVRVPESAHDTVAKTLRPKRWVKA